MSILSNLSLWQQVLLAGLALLSLIYVFYFKIWVTLAAGSDLVFAIALAVAISSIAIPWLFETAATALVDRSSLPEALIHADEKVAAIEALPSTLIQQALLKLGVEPDPIVEVFPPVKKAPGPFESRIRPSVEALVATVLRTSSFLTSTLLLLLALALRSSTSTARTLQSLTIRTEALEAHLAATSKGD